MEKKILTSVLWLLCSMLPLCAQKIDTVSRPVSYIPKGIRIGTDLVSLVRRAIPDGVLPWEIAADINFHRYVLVGEFGMSKRTLQQSTNTYSGNGYYFRIGVDVALFSKNIERSMFFLGIRYARANFSEQLYYKEKDNFFGVIEKRFSNVSKNVDWLETIIGLRVRVWKGLWAGLTARIKFMNTLEVDGDMTAFDIPGFGQVGRTTWWGISYYAYWKIPFKKQLITPK